MTNTAYMLIALISIVTGLFMTIGSYVAFRSSVAKTAQEIQERVITALEVEMQAMSKRIDELKEQNVRLNLIINTIRVALRKRGLVVSIDGDMVNIADQSGASSTVRIQEKEEKGEKP